jgi:ArsR family transcriptional regulator
MKDSKAISAFSALAQESRFAVFKLLVELPEEQGLSAGDIAAKIGVPSTTMSFHLSQLKNCSLVQAHKNGRSIVYKINRKKVRKLANLLRGQAEDEGDAKLKL